MLKRLAALVVVVLLPACLPYRGDHPVDNLGPRPIIEMRSANA